MTEEATGKLRLHKKRRRSRSLYRKNVRQIVKIAVIIMGLLLIIFMIYLINNMDFSTY